jgi:hypothetical protein
MILQRIENMCKTDIKKKFLPIKDIPTKKEEKNLRAEAFLTEYLR